MKLNFLLFTNKHIRKYHQKTQSANDFDLLLSPVNSLANDISPTRINSTDTGIIVIVCKIRVIGEPADAVEKKALTDLENLIL